MPTSTLPVVFAPRRPAAALVSVACLLAALTSACGTASHRTPVTVGEPAAAVTLPSAVAPPLDSPSATEVLTDAREVRTKQAVFRVSKFDELPGWRTDDLTSAWSAMRESCRVLERRDVWRGLCTAARNVRGDDNAAIRAFFETQFSLLSLANPDTSREGDVTGYYEPLLAGQYQQQGRFSVPVYGAPNDLLTLDLRQVPPAQRKGLITVRPSGRTLVVADTGSADGYAMDLQTFAADALDRRLRARLDGRRALPYFTREQIIAGRTLDAPVLAWVDDAVALYAMQVQGAGRIRMPDGKIVRLNYSEQNGHPFKPLRLASKAPQRIVTRGGSQPADEPEQFEILDDNAAVLPDETDEPEDAAGQPLTRGGRSAPITAVSGPGASANSGTSTQAARADALVRDLLPPAGPARPAARRTGTAPAAPVRPRAINSDPSYVFFRVAADQSSAGGPVGALGVPLTAGRSVAVDPRTTPLGYPVYLAATGPTAGGNVLQRLVFAQDAGGAIRGPVRADYFWGFGPDAGRQASRTRHRGRMWVLLPNAEAVRLRTDRVVTRGAAVAATPAVECLVHDATYCDDE